MKKRFVCPYADSNRENRINKINDQIKEWISSDDLLYLLTLFNADIMKIYDGDLHEQLNKLVAFSNVWDYRKIQSHVVTTKEREAARWLLEDDEFIKANTENILNAVNNLGLINVTEPLYSDYDYIIILGGARYTNLYRCMEAAKVVNEKSLTNCSIIALGAMRPIAESERYAVDTYAPEAQTEFDALNSGVSYAFNKANKIRFTQDSYEDENANLSWCIRHYELNNTENDIYLVAAPTTDPKRRANSADSYKFFFDKFKPESGSRILLCTSSIYIPYQHMKFFAYDIDYNIQSDMIGISELISNDCTLSKPVNYLQEVRAALMAMESFVSNYYNGLIN